MLTHLLLVAAGIAVLAFSGNKLVDLAAALAEKARVTRAVIGLTVVAAGTSAPELFVSVTAALGGSGDIAVANVVGSNICNIGLILGTCALLAPIPITQALLKFEYPFLVLASWIALLLCRDGVLDRLESVFFFASMVSFIAYSLWVARKEITAQEREQIAQAVPVHADALRRRPTWLLAFGIAAALLGLGLGARLLLSGATSIASALGVSERVIGLTVVALGTSLPELVASVVAAFKGQVEMAVTNIVGSNIFNLLFILGVTGLLRPIPVAAKLVSPDMWVMMALTVALFPLIAWDLRLSRREGAALFAAYTAYTAFLVWKA